MASLASPSGRLMGPRGRRDCNTDDHVKGAFLRRGERNSVRLCEQPRATSGRSDWFLPEMQSNTTVTFKLSMRCLLPGVNDKAVGVWHLHSWQRLRADHLFWINRLVLCQNMTATFRDVGADQERAKAAITRALSLRPGNRDSLLPSRWSALSA
jgi:hypothetical protein